MNNFTIEVGTVDFSNEDSVVLSFTESHQTVPKVVASFLNSSGAGQVSVFVSSITTLQAVINTSSKIIGKVHYHAISSIN